MSDVYNNLHQEIIVHEAKKLWDFWVLQILGVSEGEAEACSAKACSYHHIDKIQDI
jgi:hypothetical protein